MLSRPIQQLSQIEQLNFLLTNRLPRKLATQLMGKFSKIENKPLTKISLKVWEAFAPDLDLSESPLEEYPSLHACFTRPLKPDARPIEQNDSIAVSPCDGIVGAFGHVKNGQLFQAKGAPYELADLMPDKALQKEYENGIFITLRLTSTMYHRFHAPIKGHTEKVTYISGDTWNVNPPALKRINNLFCKNERAIMQLHHDDPTLSLAIVPVAAILVASIQLTDLSVPLNLSYRGPNEIAYQHSFQKGDEMGYFEHGSTLILFASQAYEFDANLHEGYRIKMGHPLLHTTRKTP